MAAASHSGTRIAYVPEATYGVTPATPSFKTLRTTRAAGLRPTKTTTESDELRADENVSDVIMTGIDVAGAYPFEFSYGSFDDLIEALLGGTWTGDEIKNGVTRRSFTIEETMEFGATDKFFRNVGAMVSSMSLNLSSRSKVEGSFGFMANREQDPAETIITGATYAAASTEAIMNTANHVGTLTIPELTTPKLAALSLNIDREMRTRPIIGSLYSDEFGFGRCRVTGSASVYITAEAVDLYLAALKHEGGVLGFTLGVETLKRYTFTLPNLRYGDVNRPEGGNSDDAMLEVPFTGVFDATEAASVVVNRAVP